MIFLLLYRNQIPRLTSPVFNIIVRYHVLFFSWRKQPDNYIFEISLIYFPSSFNEICFNFFNFFFLFSKVKPESSFTIQKLLEARVQANYEGIFHVQMLLQIAQKVHIYCCYFLCHGRMSYFSFCIHFPTCNGGVCIYVNYCTKKKQKQYQSENKFAQ